MPAGSSGGLAQSATHLSTWILGLVAGIFFLQKFETELKPLILAFVFVSILEAVVQLMEWFFQKSWILFRLLLWKSWLLVGIAVIKVCRCKVDEADIDEMWENVLCNWSDLCVRWQGSDAGKYYIFRFLSVILTLGIVVVLALLSKGLIEQEISTVIAKFELYKHQVTSMARALANYVPQLEESVPRQFRNETIHVVHSVQTSFDKAIEELPATVESMALWALNNILQSSSARLMDLAFFLLYSAFMLFDPLHINLEEAKDESPPSFAHSPSNSITDGWLVRTSGSLAGRWNSMRRSRTALGISSDSLGGAEAGAGASAASDLPFSAASAPLLGGEATCDRRPAAGLPVEVERKRAPSAPEFGSGPRLWAASGSSSVLEAAAHASAAAAAEAEERRDEPKDMQPEFQARQPSRLLRQPSRLRRASSVAGIQLNELQYYIYRIVWSYFLITVVLNVTFASAVFGLLTCLSVDLAVIISFTCFFLSFIPEIGAIVSALLPIPCILLTPTDYCHTPKELRDGELEYWRGVDIDCVHDLPLRLQRVLTCIAGMFLIKLVVSNVLSAYLMGRNKTLAGSVDQSDKEVRETHGVIVLFAVVFFGKVWGIVGMLISVPILSIVRLTFNMGTDYHRKKAEQAARLEREERRFRSESSPAHLSSSRRRGSSTVTFW